MRTTNGQNLHNPHPVPTREEFHRCFGGIVSEGDFCTNSSGRTKDIAGKIISDMKFDKLCIKNVLARSRTKKHPEVCDE